MIFQIRSKFRMLVNMTRKFAIHKNEGYALMSTVVAAYLVLMFAFAVITVSAYEIKKTDRWRKSSEALFMARSAVADAVCRLKFDYTNIGEEVYVSEPIPLFPEEGLEKGSYVYSMEPVGEVHFLGTQFMTGGFRVEALGTRGYKNRAIETRIERDTFLRYSRFVQQTGLAYASNANIMGDLYCGDNLSLNGNPVEFWGDLEIGGDIINEENGIYHGDISGIGTGIDLVESVNIAHYRDLSQGLIAGEGTGLYLSSTSTIDLDLFDFTSPTPTYNGSPLPADFNGVIFCEGDINISGTLEGQSLTFFSADDIIVKDHVRSGNTMTGSGTINPPIVFNSSPGVEQVTTRNLDSMITSDTNVLKLHMSGDKWNKARMYLLEDGEVIADAYVKRSLGSNDQTAIINNIKLDPEEHSYSAEIHYYSDSSGDSIVNVETWEGEPVNIGLVAKDKFYISSYSPRQLTIDAAILARDRSWYGLGDWSSHPNGYNTDLWELNINGPIITMHGGSAGPWSWYGSRYYDFDMDMVEYAPPAFPVPSDWWKMAYWWHLKESESTLVEGASAS